MHELSATQSILTLALAELNKVGAVKLIRIYVKLGEWSTFDPDCLKLCFGVIARGTPAETADLMIESVPVKYVCTDCGFDYIPEMGSFSCPQCSGSRGKLISGREFYVESIEVQ